MLFLQVKGAQTQSRPRACTWVWALSSSGGSHWDEAWEVLGMGAVEPPGP